MVIQKLKATGHKIYDRFIKLKGEPRQIALGFSLGLLIGMTPFMGAHIISSMILASLLRWNKISALIGVNITNVGTAPLIYPINYWVGLRLVGVSRKVKWSMAMGYPAMLNLMKHSPQILADLCMGGLILGIPLAVAGYFAALKAVYLARKRAALSTSDQSP